MIGSQGGDGIVSVMHPADIAEQCLVDAAGKVELEVGILTIAHIGKVLMRHGLKDGTRHFRDSGFRIVPVPEFTHLPVTILPDHFPRHRRKQFVGKVTRQESRMSCTQNAVVQIGCTDSQCSRMRSAVSGIAGITVNGQREFKWHFPSGGIRHIAGTAAQIVHHVRPHIDVVAIVVFTVLG